MPSTIPYDPSLALGNLVSQAKLDNLIQIGKLQAPADSAEAELNSLIALKRSVDMTIQELINMNIDASDLMKESQDVGKKVGEAAKAYAKAKIEAETKTQPLKARIAEVSDSVESPIDYNRTQVKKLPLSADSMKMNVQYFSFDENSQTSGTHSATISSFVSGEVNELGDSYSGQVSASVSAQMNSQHSRHSIAGTLVISVSCTHKDAVLLFPFCLDVDKAIRVWNAVYRDDMIKTDSMATLTKIAAQANTKEEKALTLLSGATYGSCFIGMVHILNTTDTRSSETMYAIASKLQAQFKIGGWFESASGGFGINSSFANDAKNLLSSQNITSHCSLVTVGSIPSIKSNSVQMAVKGFTDDDGSKAMTMLQKIQNATATDQDSVDSSAAAARTGNQMIALKNSTVTAALGGLADIDKLQNQVIDTNSMMTALEDYVTKCLSGNIGAPINYYLKPISKSELAQMWVAKYYPGKFLSISGDDSQVASIGAAGASGATGSSPGSTTSDTGSTAPQN
jgi:hypothetical protein